MNAYFRSIDALLLLAAFRLSTLIEWLPWLLAFSAAAVIDGFVVRQVKAKEFRQHDPEWFAAHASLGIVTICMTVIGFVLPLALHPLVMPGAPVLLSVFLGRTISSFHLRA